MIAESHAWEGSDSDEHTDYSTSPFWIVTDSGEDPEGFDSIKEARGDLTID